MRIVTLVRSEFARLTSSRIGIAALAALMIVPVIYGGLYLWGNADPYENLDKVPAAIVVADTGAVVSGDSDDEDGDEVNYGRDAADQLVEDGAFGWTVVSAADAAAGVADGTYDFGLTFPADFSADLTSVGDTDPTRATLILTTNDTNSYLSTTLAKQAASLVEVALVKQVGEKASRTLLDGIASIRSGLVDASDGAHRLADGASQAADGAQTLSSGTAAVASGAAQLSGGLAELQSQTAGLPGDAASLADGAGAVAAGVSHVNATAQQIAGVVQDAAALAPAIRAEVADALARAGVPPEEIATILARLDELANDATGADELAAGLAQLQALSDGAGQVAAGAATLSASAPALTAAIGTAATGSATLASGAADVASGSVDLSDGITELASGSAELSEGIDSGLADVPETTEADRGAMARAIADPVAVDQRAITEAQNYGAGLAPFFISLAAWIGIYALFLLVRPLSRRALTAVRRPATTTLAGWFTPAALGAVQMLALFGLITLALGLQPANPAGMLAFMVLVSATFAAIVLALNVWLGSVGQFLALVLMIVQLVTAGGTFPWQTLPFPLDAIHRFLPMSHAVDGMRVLLYGGSASGLTDAILPLVVWMLAALVLSSLGASRQSRFRTLRDLRPSPIGA